MKRIVVTGASAGIGAAVARHFLAEGWTVGLLARRAAALEAVAGGAPNAVLLPADVSDKDAVAAAFARFGALVVGFNNAGQFGPSGPIDAVAPEDFERIVAVNLTGMFLCAREAFARMREGGGRIINNGSVSAHLPREHAVCYTVTKHAITGLTRQLSLDGRDLDIACGQIDIGNARSELLEQAAAASGAAPPMMELEDVVQGVAYMAGLPLRANVQFMTVMAPKMPFAGRG
jgi:NAD(P)-dependent dehydrogenase (short-subunit alcohol dehydrogenase family)